MIRSIAYLCVLCLMTVFVQAQQIAYTVTPVQADSPYFKVELSYSGSHTDSLEFHLPAWTPGYYQLMHYAAAVRNMHAQDGTGHSLTCRRSGENSWRLYTRGNTVFTLQYEVRATRPFVAANFLAADRGFISPAGMFLYPAGGIGHPVKLTIHPAAGWTQVATGLEPVKGQAYSYTAASFDELYDSPILMGQLETLPSFEVDGKLHSFVAYQPGNFDKAAFMQDLQGIVSVAAAIMRDLPYKHYTFLGIGPGRGGIEHLNSTAVGFDGSQLDKREERIRLYHFLAHEYFHHYNVKRIRPIELGPFDYEHGSKTRLLWLSEGFTVYYEYLVVRRAGFTTREEVLQALQKNIHAYESKPGHLLQSVADASYNTWHDGPFGAGDSSISYYDKGPVLGAMLDLQIRHNTRNRYSLDDVMRALYREFYQQKGRGFTEAEFRATAEGIAGGSLAEWFDYVNTVKPPDYKRYFGYAGLDVDSNFAIRPRASMDTLQAAILKDWLR
ncbi:M61 family metallopeptidase [Chitinophaga agrisoli]|uniref:M61 family metallopeptidase n=1 Tax=Chitinophaga agrisoli TaxID=2607653 RepID=A0A5B2VJM5_9BACT|nr:M61 family metallopeptidase [Chitinophaga agrisoli]KAA2238858.1 M61 family metallopeptidase [Chitinophaga agrisoli]